jgi:hypothetical protein
MGRKGRSRSAVWVDCMVEPFGRRTWIGGCATCLLVTGTSSMMMLVVAPVSATLRLCVDGEEARFGITLGSSTSLSASVKLSQSLAFPCS